MQWKGTVPQPGAIRRLGTYVPLVIAIGVAARLIAAGAGHNYDFESFAIVSDLVAHGQNVYAHTARYNYGPVWFHVLGFLYLLSGEDAGRLRFLLAGFLSLVDVGIFGVLWQKVGPRAAIFFFLNPISIIITGYHRQFDNLAILLAMLSMCVMGVGLARQSKFRNLGGLILLGLSLMTKHLFFAFPIWLAFRQTGWKQRAMAVAIPVSVFALGFLPYWNTGHEGIVQNVFFYRSWNNDYLYRLLLPDIVRDLIGSQIVWVALMIAAGVWFRNRDGMDSVLLYTCTLVALSPSITNQYLAIPIAYVASNLNPILLSYTMLGTWHLLLDGDGLHLPIFREFANRHIYYFALVILLCLELIRQLRRRGPAQEMKVEVAGD